MVMQADAKAREAAARRAEEEAKEREVRSNRPIHRNRCEILEYISPRKVLIDTLVQHAFSFTTGHFHSPFHIFALCWSTLSSGPSVLVFTLRGRTPVLTSCHSCTQAEAHRRKEESVAREAELKKAQVELEAALAEVLWVESFFLSFTRQPCPLLCVSLSFVQL